MFGGGSEEQVALPSNPNGSRDIGDEGTPDKGVLSGDWPLRRAQGVT